MVVKIVLVISVQVAARDPDDDMVLECAVASGSQYIVTHNLKDFRRVPELKVHAITPADFLKLLRKSP